MILRKALFLLIIPLLIILPTSIPSQQSAPVQSGHHEALGSSLFSSIGNGSFSQSPSQTGIIIPLYTYPTDQSWQEVAQAKVENPSVPIIAVINPDSGPGVSLDSNYVSGINLLENSGVIVLGYDHTSYGTRSLADVEADINSYHSWYNVSGIFFDEMASTTGYESYYSTLNTYAKNLGYTMTVGNPGSSVPSSYIGTLSSICIYENGGLPSIQVLSSRTSGYGKENFAMIAYGVSALNSTFETSASSYVGWEYITTANLPNPYNMLPSYFLTEVSNLAQSSPPPAKNVSLVVNSLNLTGSSLLGPWATIESTNGSILSAGYTPLNYTAKSGLTYRVIMSNDSTYTFDHWNNGSRLLSLTLTPFQSISLDAYYTTNTPVTTSSTTETVTSTSTQVSNITSTANFGVTVSHEGSTTISQTSTVTSVLTESRSASSSQMIGIDPVQAAQIAGIVLIMTLAASIALRKH